MSEEIVEEKSLTELIIEKITNAEAPVVVFFSIFLVLSGLLYCGKISPELFEKMVLSDGLISAILKLVKRSDSS